jgi:peptide deformylase
LPLLLFTITYDKKFTEAEHSLIIYGTKEQVMRVLQVTNAGDLKLRAASSDLNLRDDSLELLIDRIYTTVKDPASAGVGIAAPQVGIKRNGRRLYGSYFSV